MTDIFKYNQVEASNFVISKQKNQSRENKMGNGESLFKNLFVFWFKAWWANLWTKSYSSQVLKKKNVTSLNFIWQ